MEIEDWVNIVTIPLGLGGFALFLVFSLVRVKGIRRQYRWLTPTFAIFAAVALFGGLSLDFLAKQSASNERPETNTNDNSTIDKNTEGNTPKLSGKITIKTKTKGQKSPAIGINNAPINYGPETISELQTDVPSLSN